MGGTPKFPPQIQGMLLVTIFSSYWVECHIINSLKYIAMYSCASYYFANGGPTNATGHAVVRDGISTSIFKHFGSIAFSALIAAIIKTLEALLNSGDNEDGN